MMIPGEVNALKKNLKRYGGLKIYSNARGDFFLSCRSKAKSFFSSLRIEAQGVGAREAVPIAKDL